ncbi:HesA/MoeB/ThiF family protein [Dysgonomonas sp. 216]|uniref:HesA/MoeB/ThiF family protein n=1 Tax=Dysgonomonas sp. 216 TaxID=2302934 RepID=UPI0013D5E371|nr:HesA/MoeB/ThiF family protein [Dysgonomonas sp. 216]NDW19193.1 HesA/MoeB/ThiF family protein [Dysgonomonas sp. 216]
MDRRYERNILVEAIGDEGQQKLLQSKILVIGAGGLGSPVLYYLASAGVGTLGIIDHDVVDITNLQRQVLHRTADVGRHKAESAREKLEALNPDIKVNIYKEKFTLSNASELVQDYDFVIDCCDNYETKFLINDVCVGLGKAYSHGAALAMRGEVMTYTSGNACYRCIFGSEPNDGALPSSKQIGIVGAIAGTIGSIQAAEAIKYITGMEGLLTNRLLVFDGKIMSFQTLSVRQNSGCVCSKQ